MTMLSRVARFLVAPQRVPAEFRNGQNGLAEIEPERAEAVWAPAWLYL